MKKFEVKETRQEMIEFVVETIDSMLTFSEETYKTYWLNSKGQYDFVFVDCDEYGYMYYHLYLDNEDLDFFINMLNPRRIKAEIAYWIKNNINNQ